MPPAPFAASTPPDFVVTVGTLSKSVWGGLRVGWLRTEPYVVRRLAQKAGHTEPSGPVLEQLAACHLLAAEAELLAARRNAVRAGPDALVAALAPPPTGLAGLLARGRPGAVVPATRPLVLPAGRRRRGPRPAPG